MRLAATPWYPESSDAAVEAVMGPRRLTRSFANGRHVVKAAIEVCSRADVVRALGFVFHYGGLRMRRTG